MGSTVRTFQNPQGMEGNAADSEKVLFGKNGIPFRTAKRDEKQPYRGSKNSESGIVPSRNTHSTGRNKAQKICQGKRNTGWKLSTKIYKPHIFYKKTEKSEKCQEKG